MANKRGPNYQKVRDEVRYTYICIDRILNYSVHTKRQVEDKGDYQIARYFAEMDK